MRLTLILLLVTTSALADGVTYRCKGPDGTWAASYCTGKLAPQESEYAKDQRERQRSADEDKELYQKYSRYCYDIGQGWGTECSTRQIEAYHFVRKILSESAEGSTQHKKILACIARFQNKATGMFDASSIKLCYTLP